MTTLVEFLEARLDDDAERASFVAAQIADGRYEFEPWRLSWHDEYDLLCIEPSRALREVEAKRRIVAEHRYGRAGRGVTVHDKATLRHLAAVYSDHEDFQEAWRV